MRPVAVVTGKQTRAYWVSHNNLVQREILPSGSQGQKTVVVSDALAGSPVVAAASQNSDIVLYIAESPTPRSATLWIEGRGSFPVSRDGGSATSVAMVQTESNRFVLFALDGRLGMSPIHAIPLEFDERGAPVFGEDRVVYVAGQAERHSTLTTTVVGGFPLVLMPISQSASNFGLMLLRVGIDEESPSWVDYPNGLDPAPIAAATVCGKPTIAFVHHESADPSSKKVLELAWLNDQAGLTDRTIVDKETAIRHVALADGGNGAGSGWVVYSTSHELRGKRFGCRQ